MSAARQLRGTPLSEVVAYGLLTALGALVFVSAFSYGILEEDGRAEPGLLPMAAGGLLAVLSAIELVARLRTHRATPHASPLARLGGGRRPAPPSPRLRRGRRGPRPPATSAARTTSTCSAGRRSSACATCGSSSRR